MISALPAALAGIAWFLFDHSDDSERSSTMGTIMCMGVATSNRHSGGEFRDRADGGRKDSISAALEAGFTGFAGY